MRILPMLFGSSGAVRRVCLNKIGFKHKSRCEPHRATDRSSAGPVKTVEIGFPDADILAAVEAFANGINGGAMIDHETRVSGVLWRSKSRPPHFGFKTLQCSCVCGTPGGVYKVEVYARVRRAVQVDGMSIREAARQFDLSRKTDPEDAAVFAAAGL